MPGSRCGLRGRFFPGGRRHTVRSQQWFPAIGVAGRPVGGQALGSATPLEGDGGSGLGSPPIERLSR